MLGQNVAKLAYISIKYIHIYPKWNVIDVIDYLLYNLNFPESPLSRKYL